MMEPCPVCGNIDLETHGAYRAKHSTFSSLKRAHCRKCGMIFSRPMLHEPALNEYNATYFASAYGGRPRDRGSAAFHSGIARLRLAHIESYLTLRNMAVSSVLEIGPGSGFLAQHWIAKYPGTSYYGCETDAACHGMLREMGVHLAELSELTKHGRGGSFDLVLMSHVLEHVQNPTCFLMDATQKLRKGGVLFIEVPCRDDEHKRLDEPHLLFFDKGPMQHLLQKVGFYDIQATYHGQEIERLRSTSAWRAKAMAVRSKLIAIGIVWPFARIRPGMECLTDPLERATVAPFQAHLEKNEPAWWLRAVARKGSSSQSIRK